MSSVSSATVQLFLSSTQNPKNLDFVNFMELRLQERHGYLPRSTKSKASSKYPTLMLLEPELTKIVLISGSDAREFSS